MRLLPAFLFLAANLFSQSFEIRFADYWQSNEPLNKNQKTAIVLPTGTGAFSNHDNQVAFYDGRQWRFRTPADFEFYAVKGMTGILMYSPNDTNWRRVRMENLLSEITVDQGDFTNIQIGGSIVISNISNVVIDDDNTLPTSGAVYDAVILLSNYFASFTNVYLEDLVTRTTTSATPALMGTLSNNFTAGRYLVNLSGFISHSSAVSAASVFGLYTNGGLVPGSLRTNDSFASGANFNLVSQAVVVFLTNNVRLEAYFSTSAATLSAKTKSMVVRREP